MGLILPLCLKMISAAYGSKPVSSVSSRNAAMNLLSPLLAPPPGNINGLPCRPAVRRMPRCVSTMAVPLLLYLIPDIEL